MAIPRFNIVKRRLLKQTLAHYDGLRGKYRCLEIHGVSYSASDPDCVRISGVGLHGQPMAIKIRDTHFQRLLEKRYITVDLGNDRVDSYEIIKLHTT